MTQPVDRAVGEYQRVLRDLIAEAQPYITCELRYAAERVTVSSPTPTTVGGDPVRAAAFVGMLGAALDAGQLTCKVSKPKPSVPRGKRAEPLLGVESVAQVTLPLHGVPVEMEGHALLKSTHAAVGALRGIRSIEDQMRDPPGRAIGAKEAWEVLVRQLRAVQSSLDVLEAARGTGRGRPGWERDAGEIWWHATQDLERLGWAMDVVRGTSKVTEELPQEHLPLDQRWETRAKALLQEIEARLVSLVQRPAWEKDVPAMASRPKGVLLMGPRIVSDEMMEGFVQRSSAMGLALADYRGRVIGETSQAADWRSTAWIVKAVGQYCGGKISARALGDAAASGGLKKIAKRSGERGTYQIDVIALVKLPKYQAWAEGINRARAEGFTPRLRAKKAVKRGSATKKRKTT